MNARISVFYLRRKFIVGVAAILLASAATWLPIVLDHYTGAALVTPLYADDEEHGGS
ncbi:MAG: hypothetical protein R2911_38975 [Caldilineaceae bacterium]